MNFDQHHHHIKKCTRQNCGGGGGVGELCFVDFLHCGNNAFFVESFNGQINIEFAERSLNTELQTNEIRFIFSGCFSNDSEKKDDNFY